MNSHQRRKARRAYVHTRKLWAKRMLPTIAKMDVADQRRVVEELKISARSYTLLNYIVVCDDELTPVEQSYLKKHKNSYGRITLTHTDASSSRARYLQMPDLTP